MRIHLGVIFTEFLHKSSSKNMSKKIFPKIKYIFTWNLLKTTDVDLRTKFNRHTGPNPDHYSCNCNVLKKLSENLSHHSLVFISNESRHNAAFAYTLIGKLRQIVPDIENDSLLD